MGWCVCVCVGSIRISAMSVWYIVVRVRVRVCCVW